LFPAGGLFSDCAYSGVERFSLLS